MTAPQTAIRPPKVKLQFAIVLIAAFSLSPVSAQDKTDNPDNRDTSTLTLSSPLEYQQAGWNFPWFVAQATYHTPDDPSCLPIRDAQRSLWQTDLAFEGPDTLTAPYRQNGGKGTHFNDAGLKAPASYGQTKCRNISTRCCTDTAAKNRSRHSSAISSSAANHVWYVLSTAI